MQKEIRVFPIGYVSSPVTVPTDENWGQVISRIVINPECANGLQGLGGFSHAIIVTYLHQAKYDSARHLVRHPRGLESMPEVGIFSQRSKDRPNAIGITTVSIRKVGGDYVEVQGLDVIHDTPVLDIKPCYSQYDDIGPICQPDWVDELMKDYF